MKQGKIAQVIGPVVDVAFDGDYLPRIKEALTVEVQGRTLVMEVARHMGGRIGAAASCWTAPRAWPGI